MGLRQTAYRLFASCPYLILDLDTGSVMQTFSRGLQDPSLDVRLAALEACVKYLQACDTHLGGGGGVVANANAGANAHSASLPRG